ncbi:hypothetical protein HA402_001866 [Bradysia odoriphaga]|nr:hypothetical protein HA402_001866 [Bradysia odoriphaga]
MHSEEVNKINMALKYCDQLKNNLHASIKHVQMLNKKYNTRDYLSLSASIFGSPRTNVTMRKQHNNSAPLTTKKEPTRSIRDIRQNFNHIIVDGIKLRREVETAATHLKLLRNEHQIESPYMIKRRLQSTINSSASTSFGCRHGRCFQNSSLDRYGGLDQSVLTSIIRSRNSVDAMAMSPTPSQRKRTRDTLHNQVAIRAQCKVNAQSPVNVKKFRFQSTPIKIDEPTSSPTANRSSSLNISAINSSSGCSSQSIVDDDESYGSRGTSSTMQLTETETDLLDTDCESEKNFDLPMTETECVDESYNKNWRFNENFHRPKATHFTKDIQREFPSTENEPFHHGDSTRNSVDRKRTISPRRFNENFHRPKSNVLPDRKPAVMLTVSATAAADCQNCKKTHRDKVRYSVRTVWSNYKKRDQCLRAYVQDWEDDVQKYYDGCEDTASEFEGEANDRAAVVMDSFRQFLSKLMEYANSNSTIVSSSGASMIKAMGKCNKLGKSSMVILTEFEKVFPSVANDMTKVALKLSEHIDHLAETFTDAVQELSGIYSKYMRDLLLSCRLTGCKKEVSYEPTLQKLQRLMNLVALIAETLFKECDATIEVQESVLVLALITWWFQIILQGKLVITMDILQRSDCAISQNLTSLSLSFDYVLVSITQAISGVVVPIVNSFKEFLSIFVNTILALNTAVKDIFGVFNGVTVTVGEIARNLFKRLKITSTLFGRTNFVKGVRGVGSN